MNLNKYPKMQRLQNNTIPRFWHYFKKKNIPKTFNRKKKRKNFLLTRWVFVFAILLTVLSRLHPVSLKYTTTHSYVYIAFIKLSKISFKNSLFKGNQTLQ